MDTHTIAIACALIALLLTPLYVYAIVKGVRATRDLRSLAALMGRPVPGRQHRTARGRER